MEIIIFNVLENNNAFNYFFSIPLNLAIPVTLGVAIMSLVKDLKL